MTYQNISGSLSQIIQKYNLDISIVESVKIYGKNRLDPEFYGIDYTLKDTVLEKKLLVSLESLSKSIINFGAYSLTSQINYLTEGVPYIQVGNIKPFLLEGEFKLIDEKLSETVLKKSLVSDGQILFTIAGTIGNACVARGLPKNTNSNQAIANIRLNDGIDPDYVCAFLNSDFGIFQSRRLIVSNVQPNLLLTQVKEIKLPLPSDTFQQRIAEFAQEAHRQIELSKSLYTEAEKILLDELRLIDWQPIEENIAEKMSEEVSLFGRCDAEFFQPKYDELFGKLTKFKTKKLGELVDYQKGVEPGADAYADEGIPFIRVADVSIQGIDTIEKKISPALLAEYGNKYSPKKDEILFTKDGTIGISFVINEDMEAVLSGAFLRLQKKIKMESEYLALVLNSLVCKMQIERFSGGAIIAHLKPSDAMEIIIPILADSAQLLISQKIIASHEARKKSKDLLEKAKRAVEIFVEEDEKEANKYLGTN